MNKVDSNLNARPRNQHNEPVIKKKEKLKEVDYIDFDETPD